MDQPTAVLAPVVGDAPGAVTPRSRPRWPGILSFGLAVANLRRHPIYLNHQARWALGYGETETLADIAGPAFEEFLSNAARHYQNQLKSFFFEAAHKGKPLNVHLEQVYSARKQICGVMVIIQNPPS